MNTEHIKQPPHERLWHTAKEYLTHWFTAGVIVALTGFTPDHWVAHWFHTAHLDSFLVLLPATDYRLIAVGLGVAFIAGDICLRNRRMSKASHGHAPAANMASDGPGTHVGKPSIAVLPFLNMSDDKGQEYLADGMTEDIITGLSYDSRLIVIARNSTFAYKGQAPDIRTVGKELGVRYVLEGSIRPIEDRIRITVQLIETANGTHVWADKIDRKLTEIYDIMDHVTDGLVTALCSNLGVAEARRAERSRPEDLQAWALCMQADAMYYLSPSAKTQMEAEKLARRAAEIEPGYGASWGLIAFLVSQRNLFGVGTDTIKDMQEAMSLASKALSIAPHDALVLRYCGAAYRAAGNISQALDYLERSLEINPGSSLARLAYGVSLLYAGRPEACITQLDLCLILSPKDPYTGLVYSFYTWCYLLVDEAEKAEQAARSAVKLMPGHNGANIGLAVTLTAMGAHSEAEQQNQKVRQLFPNWTPKTLEDSWRMTFKNREQFDKLSGLLHQAFPQTSSAAG